jgi:hypothetical protein
MFILELASRSRVDGVGGRERQRAAFARGRGAASERGSVRGGSPTAVLRPVQPRAALSA